MRILITGADIEQNGDVYEVVYEGKVVFRDKLRTLCVVVGLDRDRLNELWAAQPNVYKFRAM